jgi:F-type H+-transporting ATPase subunit c
MGRTRTRPRDQSREAATGRPHPSYRRVHIVEGTIVTRCLLTLVFLLVASLVPAFAQEAAGETQTALVQWSIITAGFALAIAAGLGAIGQGRSVGQAVEAIARNPSAVGDIRGALILGLVLIESLVIYVLLISLILFFVQPFGGV